MLSIKFLLSPARPPSSAPPCPRLHGARRREASPPAKTTFTGFFHRKGQRCRELLALYQLRVATRDGADPAQIVLAGAGGSLASRGAALGAEMGSHHTPIFFWVAALSPSGLARGWVLPGRTFLGEQSYHWYPWLSEGLLQCRISLTFGSKWMGWCRGKVQGVLLEVPAAAW